MTQVKSDARHVVIFAKAPRLGTVKRRLFTAKAKLREMLEEE